MSSSNIIFYSKRCKHCKKLFDILNMYNYINEFKTYCIDDDKQYNIEFVPAIILSGINKVFYGKDVFDIIYFNIKKNLITNDINNNKMLENIKSIHETNVNKLDNIFNAIEGKNYADLEYNINNDLDFSKLIIFK